MKITTLLILLFLFTSCLSDKNKNSNTIAMEVPTIETDLCFAIDSIRFCEDKTDSFCPKLPLDVYYLNSKDGQFQNGYSSTLSPNTQPSFANFSWQSFIALNWPADSNGNPVGELNENTNNKRVWEYYTDASTVFNSAPKGVTNLNTTQGKKILHLSSKNPESIQVSEFLEADDYPLIDRNLNFVVFEEKMNSIEELFITKNNLTTKEGIYNYKKKHGDFQLPTNTDKKVGAMEIKASWRIIDTSKGDDASLFFTREATIFVDADNSISGQSFTIDCTIGLVGLHILRKTKKFNNWVWSTFEHVDNVPDNVQEAQTDQETNWSFYNPECLNCAPNTPPQHIAGDTLSNGTVVYRWNTTAPYGARYGVTVAGEANGKAFGTQVTRVYPVYYCTEQLNSIWQSKLKALGSVFANYKLVGTQWMLPLDAPPFSKINAPFFLGNTTAETYMQDSASCISCHDFATVKYNGETIKTDFSFLFSKAK
ncbi:hypothetical protein [uncultured Lacinutrix sp.]|uniref:hypothetical protein n=1 Tax=uncultured Lacinutrix sp. TaxID=574032 RepID=UPI002619E38E|nr:hypothetical protein [uncultured Lacinutrix sp.]